MQTSEYAGNIRAAEENQYEAAERPEEGRKCPVRGSYRFSLHMQRDKFLIAACLFRLSEIL